MRNAFLSLLGTAVLLAGCASTSQAEASRTDDTQDEGQVAEAQVEEEGEDQGQGSIAVEQEVGTDEPGDDELAGGAGSGSATVRTGDSATGTGGDVGQDEPYVAGETEVEPRYGDEGAVAATPGEGEEGGLHDEVAVAGEEDRDEYETGAQAGEGEFEAGAQAQAGESEFETGAQAGESEMGAQTGQSESGMTAEAELGDESGIQAEGQMGEEGARERHSNGRVARVDTEQGRLVLDEQGEERTYHAESQDLQDVEAGQQVSVTWEARGNEAWVKDLEKQEQDEAQQQQEAQPQEQEFQQQGQPQPQE